MQRRHTTRERTVVDPRTPVIVGVGQVNGADGADEPIDLVVTAIERALDDAGAAVPLDLIALTKIGTQQYRNAPALVGARLGRPDARTMQANHGGHTSQVVLAHLAAEIAQGRLDAAVVAGGELGSAIRSGRLVADLGTPTDDDPDAGSDLPCPDEALGDDLYQWIGHPHELALGIAEPVQMYPMMDTALGAALGRTRDEHVAEVSRLWARLSHVAMTNDYAVDRRGHSADEIATATSRNRYVGYPYTKLMNSDQFVDQAAAIMICSAEVAASLNIRRDRWVFPWAGVTANEAFVSERHHLHESRALAGAARRLETMVDRPLNEFDLVDLYACFPFAVQTQDNALGLSVDRDVSLTGGMRFAGGPWNNYGTHMVANIVTRLRETPSSTAVCSTNGGLATRFCVTAYSGNPTTDGFRFLPSPFVDPGPRRRLETRPTGAASIEGYTIPHGRDNEPSHAIAACRLANGARAWARLDDDADVQELLAVDPIGRRVRFTASGARLENA
jgi:acetyl-CoA C-acetyltransferase